MFLRAAIGLPERCTRYPAGCSPQDRDPDREARQPGRNRGCRIPVRHDEQGLDSSRTGCRRDFHPPHTSPAIRTGSKMVRQARRGRSPPSAAGLLPPKTNTKAKNARWRRRRGRSQLRAIRGAGQHRPEWESQHRPERPAELQQRHRQYNFAAVEPVHRQLAGHQQGYSVAPTPPLVRAASAATKPSEKLNSARSSLSSPARQARASFPESVVRATRRERRRRCRAADRRRAAFRFPSRSTSQIR